MNPVLIKIMTNFAIGFEADLSQMLWMWIIEDTIDKKNVALFCKHYDGSFSISPQQLPFTHVLQAAG